MADNIFAITTVAPAATGDGFPAGAAITSVVGRAFDLNDMAAFTLYLHRQMSGGAAPLEFHWPMPPTGKVWRLTDEKLNWWDGLTPPFKAYSRPELEKRIVWFGSAADIYPHYRQFDYAMDVLAVSGLRFKVYDDPAHPVEGSSQIWVLAHMTQPAP